MFNVSGSGPIYLPDVLSIEVLADWDAALRMGRHEIALNKFDVNIPFTGDSVPVIDMTDIDIVS